MPIAQVTFIPKNPKCVSLKIRRYLVDTGDKEEALEVASKLLKAEKHFDRYSALPVIIVDVHDTKEER